VRAGLRLAMAHRTGECVTRVQNRQRTWGEGLMQLNEEDRLVVSYARPSSGRPLLIALLVVVALGATGAMAYTAVPEFRAYVNRVAAAVTADAIKAPLQPVQQQLAEERYAAAYQRLNGLPHLPAEVLASATVANGVARLAREPCDKEAIYAFGTALEAAHQGRLAAESYLAFAANCPNGYGERRRAAQVLSGLGDSDKAIAILDPLIAENPAADDLHYLRGRALASVKRYTDAIEDYKATVALMNQRNIGDWVFVELANLYASTGRPCDAASAIMAYVAIDPGTHDTAKARKLIETYTAKGCGKNLAPMAIRKP
jgi:aspartyl protease family protein